MASNFECLDMPWGNPSRPIVQSHELKSRIFHLQQGCGCIPEQGRHVPPPSSKLHADLPSWHSEVCFGWILQTSEIQCQTVATDCAARPFCHRKGYASLLLEATKFRASTSHPTGTPTYTLVNYRVHNIDILKRVLSYWMQCLSS
jgi:hypothetical protein